MPNPFLTPAILGGLGTAITTFLQDRAAKRRMALAHRTAELEKANGIFRELSDVLTSFNAFNKECMYALVFKREPTEEDKKAWAAYQSALLSWKKSKARYLALVKKYFGPQALEILEDIERGFDTMESQVAATYFKRTNSRHYLADTKEGKGKNDFRKKYFRNQRPLEKKIIELSEMMIDAIQREEVGALGITRA